MKQLLSSSRRRQLLIALAAVTLSLPAAGSAEAAWPGENGLVVFVGSRNVGEDGQQADGLRSVMLGRPETLRVLSTDVRDRDPQISPDGRQIVFTREISPTAGSLPRSAAIFAMGIEGGEVRQLTEPGPGAWDGNPSFDASGRRIVFVRRGGSKVASHIFSLGLSSGRLKQLTSGNSEDGSLAVSPDGRQIVFQRTYVRRRDGRMFSHIFSMRPNGSHLRDLTAGGAIGQAINPDFSPDGRSIVFAEGALWDSELFTMRRNGARLRKLRHRQLRAKGMAEPVFSPSGKTILAVAVDLYGSQLVRLGLGRKPRIHWLVKEIYGSSPAWGPAP